VATTKSTAVPAVETKAEPESVAADLVATPAGASAPESKGDAPVADAAPAEVVPATGVDVVFNWPLASVVAGVGRVKPGEHVPVSESVAASLCRGEPPMFVRATA
jgi:hypothetical protein